MLLTTLRTARESATKCATRRTAFTLLEVLIVVAILVILAGAASIALFQNLEKGKIGRAKSDMRIIEQAIKQYYLEHNEWPQQGQDGLVAIASSLEQGSNALIDPWGGRYDWVLDETPDDVEGLVKQRPIVFCQPPDQNKPRIQWPER